MRQTTRRSKLLRPRRYRVRARVEVLDARELPDMRCPECSGDVARITYAVNLPSDVPHMVTTVNACQDTDLCNWSEVVA